MPLDCLREGIKEKNQAQLGVPHSKIQVELGLIFNFTWNPRQSRICQRNRTPLGGHGRWEGGGHRTYFLDWAIFNLILNLILNPILSPNLEPNIEPQY